MQEQQAADSAALIDGFDVSFCDDMETIWRAGFGPNSRNRSNLGELIGGFFYFYSYVFDYHEGVVCVRQGHTLTKHDKGWTRSAQESKGPLPANQPRNRFNFCIEDPFELTHNLGRVVNTNSLHFIRGEFMRGHRCLCEGRSFTELCEEVLEVPSRDALKKRRDQIISANDAKAGRTRKNSSSSSSGTKGAKGERTRKDSESAAAAAAAADDDGNEDDDARSVASSLTSDESSDDEEGDS